MNPLTYCAFASCSDKDWEVFGVMALIAIGFAIVIGVIANFGEKQRKDKDMK